MNWKPFVTDATSKGPDGIADIVGTDRMNRMSCREAISESVDELGAGPFKAESLFKRTREKGDWTDDTIWQHLMHLVINLPPAYRHWSPKTERFLVLREDGLYERYVPRKHGDYKMGERI